MSKKNFVWDNFNKLDISKKRMFIDSETKKRKIKRKQVNRKITKICLITFLIAYALLSLYPFFWTLFASFHEPSQVNRLGLLPWLSDSIFTTKNFTGFFNKGITQMYAGRWILNSVLYSTLNASINCFFNFLSGYALARIAFRGRKTAVWIMLAATMIPVQATQIPQLIILIKLGIIGNNSNYFIFMIGILGTGMTSTVLIFQVRQFYINQSSSIEEAGLIDGLSRFKVFIKVSIKSMLPLLATQWAMVFIGSWNNFIMFQLWSFGRPNFINFVGGLVMSSADKESFDGMGRLLAGTNLSIAPVLLVYTLSLKFQKKIMVDGEK